jgi:hypothetical protein
MNLIKFFSKKPRYFQFRAIKTLKILWPQCQSLSIILLVIEKSESDI